MTPHFAAVVDPQSRVLETIAASHAANPFYSASYIAARKAVGHIPCLLGIESAERIEEGCIGFLYGNSLFRILEIMSIANFSRPSIFWDGLRRFCRQRRVWDLFVNTFA